MKHLTLDVAKRLLSVTQTQKRLPKPFPGDAPTRVAWHIEVFPKVVVRKYYKPGNGGPEVAFDKHLEGRHEVLSYVGKPSVYRSLQAANLFREPPGEIRAYWCVEFDRAGPLAGILRFADGKVGTQMCVNAYWAFHPQSASGQVWDAYTRRFFLKRIGRLPTYSYQQKLSQEKIDAFYAWYEKVFERKLKRPKQKPMIVGTGVADEADE